MLNKAFDTKEKKTKSKFGERSNNGSFGEKPNNGNFGKRIKKEKLKDNSFSVKKTSKGTFGNKPNNGNFGKKRTFIKTISSSKKGDITELEQRYLTWLHEDAQTFRFKCFVCNRINPNDPIKWHHLKKHSSDKKNHKRMIPLCDNEHHRLGKVMSPHGTPRKFRETYSQEIQNKVADKIWSLLLTENSMETF